MTKPKSYLRTGILVLTTSFGLLIFPSLTSFPHNSDAALAQGVSSPNPSVSATPTVTPTATPTSTPTGSPTPTETPTPTPTPTGFNPNLYSLTDPTSIWVIVDKKRPLNPLSYVPKSLVVPKFTDGAGINPYKIRLAKVAAKAMKVMATAMHQAGAGVLVLSSTYRSYNTQVAVHAKDVAALGLIAGENLAARPGYSEHQTGLAADLAAVGQGCVVNVCFAKTKAGAWLAANAWQYGFILRYPKGQTAITGYQFEPWHYRYVGTELSTQMHNTGVTVLENFFGLPAAPKY